MDVIKKGHARDTQRYKVDYESQSTDTQNFSSESKRETEYVRTFPLLGVRGEGNTPKSVFMQQVPGVLVQRWAASPFQALLSNSESLGRVKLNYTSKKSDGPCRRSGLSPKLALVYSLGFPKPLVLFLDHFPDPLCTLERANETEGDGYYPRTLCEKNALERHITHSSWDGPVAVERLSKQ